MSSTPEVRILRSYGPRSRPSPFDDSLRNTAVRASETDEQGPPSLMPPLRRWDYLVNGVPEVLSPPAGITDVRPHMCPRPPKLPVRRVIWRAGSARVLDRGDRPPSRGGVQTHREDEWSCSIRAWVARDDLLGPAVYLVVDPVRFDGDPELDGIP